MPHRFVFGFRSSARRSALHRARLDDAAVLLDEQLRRRRQDCHVSGIDETAIRNALLQAQVAIQRQGRALQIELGFECQVQLVDIAGADFVLNLVEAFEVRRRIPAMCERSKRRIADGFRRQPLLDIGARHGARLGVNAKPQQRNLAIGRH